MNASNGSRLRRLHDTVVKAKKDTSSNRLTGVEAALRRAGQRARELAAKTGTPLVIYSEGKIKKLRILPKQGNRSS
jgi:hypothetical protein